MFSLPIVGGASDSVVGLSVVAVSGCGSGSGRLMEPLSVVSAVAITRSVCCVC